jgi:hypothetical protein
MYASANIFIKEMNDQELSAFCRWPFKLCDLVSSDLGLQLE